MRAVGYRSKGQIDGEGALVDLEIGRPTPAGRDLLVEVKAVSVNPADVKIRSWVQPGDGVPKILGWDAAGIVSEIGPDVETFAVGDAVYYAGSLDRSGTNAAFHVVDERIVGRKPRSLDWAEAAALPLTSITGWEALFDRLDVAKPVAGGARAILIVGGAGGVGSITIQLARALTDLTVIATASRPETSDWVRAMGAHHVVDHSRPLAAQVAALGIGAPSFVFSTTHSDRHVGEIVELLAPQGRFALIDDPETFDIVPFKRKSISVHWELMFTRPLYGTADIAAQGALLDKVAELVDAGAVRTTMTQRLGPIDAATLTVAHRAIESNTTRGKIVVEGFLAG